ncbi:MAG: DUF3179 domain-containing (seleno)protein [Longimicrobiales bacterium]
MCNTGIGLIPEVGGEVHRFTEQGLYDGLFLMMDHETGSRWNHMTGEAVHGPLVGERLPLENVLHTTVGQVLVEAPDALLAWSDHPAALQRSGDGGGTLRRLLARIRGVPDMFPPTMGEEDDRRDRMEMGIGIWRDGLARYYPMPTVEAMDNALFDDFDGENVLVYYDPTAHALAAERTDATDATWDEDILRLSDGGWIEDGILYDAEGSRKERDRPLQVFTRWYGFSLTFPETEIFERRPVSD